VTDPQGLPKSVDALAHAAADAVSRRDWPELTALLRGPLVPELHQPVLRVLRREENLEPLTLSDLSRTLVRRLEVGADAAVLDLQLWREAPEPLRTLRLDAYALMVSGRKGDREAALAAPAAWRTLLDADGFEQLPVQARAVALIDAAQAHWRAARTDGGIPDLRLAVEFGERAARVAGELPHAAEALTVAGDAALQLWNLAPGLGDLDQAFQFAVAAYARTPPEHPRLGWRAGRLASRLVDRSVRDGTVAPLDEALVLLQEAPDDTADPEDRCGVLHALAMAAGRRWEITKELGDAELAVRAARRAVREVPPESKDIRIMRSGLATALQRRGRANDNPDDLREALEIRRDVVGLETDEPRKAMVRANLGLTLRALGERTGDRAFLDESVDVMNCAVGLTPSDSARYAMRLHDLGLCYRARGAGEDRRTAHQKMEQALTAAAGRPEVQAVIANDIGSLLREDGQDSGAASAYEAALDAMLDLQRREDQIADRLIQLGRVENLPANATYAALRARGTEPALAVADKGRSVVLSQLLGRPAAPAAYPVTGNMLCVGAGDAGGFAILSTSSASTAVECREVTSLAIQERSRLLAAGLARRGDDPDAANEAILDLASWLGDALCLDRLSLPDELSVVTLGPLSLLPVHLSMYRGRPLCLQRVVTMRLRPSVLHSGVGVPEDLEAVAVSPESRRADPLLLAEHEVRALSEAVSRCAILKGPDASREQALAALGRVDVAHFTAHARSFPDHPLDSCVHLSNDEITVTDLLSTLQGGSLELVTFTGCETSVAGRRVPDESVSLAAASVVAGARNVLSAVWPVSQLAAALICTRFYANWARRPGHADSALAEAQRWLCDAPVDQIAAACERLDAPVTDPQRLSEPLHWGAWTVTAA
jgi:tetratricopeptide (TPR) repeat protein